MASSLLPDLGPLRAPQGVHLLLAVGLPAAFWNLAAYWVLGSAPSWPGTPFGLAYALVLGFWAPWRQRTKQGPLLKLWVWIAATLLFYAGLALVEGQPWPLTFNFVGIHILWFIPGFLQGQLTVLWAGQLASRARLFQLIEGLPSGKSLEDRVRDFHLDADFSRSNEAALSSSLAVLATLTVVMAVFSPFGKDGLSALLAGGFLTLCLLTGVLFRTYRREMEALTYGYRFTLADKAAPLGWSALLVVLSALGAWGLVALGGPWIDWDRLFQGRHEPIPAPPPEAFLPVPSQSLDLDPGSYKMAVLMALLERIFRFQTLLNAVNLFIRAAVFILPWAAAVFVFWPLAKWLLSSGGETEGLGRRWWQLLIEQWRAFWVVLAGWWLRPSIAEGTPGEISNTREWLRSLFRRQAPGRRVPYPEVVEGFLALVKWAEPLTAYRRGETTREFLDRLSALVPPAAQDLAVVRDLLDRELFGRRGLDSPDRRTFLRLVASLTAEPPSHDSARGVS